MATATFHYRAITADGKERSGVITADDSKSVARQLVRQGLTPVYVGFEEKKLNALAIKLPSFASNRRKDVLFFTQELSTLLNSGVPLDRALSIASELTTRPQFRGIILDILRTIKGGKSLADSLAIHPSYFSDLFVNMVRAGEASGSLGQIFERLSEFERSRDELRSYIISSMIYPGLLTVVGAGSIFLILNFVVPRFATIFDDGHMKIPLPTEIMLEASKVVREWWWVVAIVLIAITGSFRTYIRTAAGKTWWDDTRLKLPMIGDALRKAETSRFARAMSTLVGNTVPLVQSLHISAGILYNSRIAKSLNDVAQGVKRGEGIAGPLARTKMFPPLAAHLLTVGEETGKLDLMFARMADIYEEETRAAVKRFTAIFEPLVILLMGIIVGGLILSMLIAITSINDVAL
ncbi:MAG TPA: type II secretion system F family protein [Bryobacteraceae bacterium]|jgi:general secretion pathway protein F|nr:type II secretion system F family protein [Bryobacteraceae bacterium]